MALVRLLTLRTPHCVRSGIRSREGILKQTQSLHSTARNHKLLDVIRHVYADEGENFNETFVKKAHKWDNVNDKEWTLIYRDMAASRSFFMVSTIIPIFVIGAIIIGYDINHNTPNNRMDIVQRLVRDTDELGYFLVFPSIALVIVSALILRLQQCRLLRIYQNRTNPEQFSAVASKMIVGQTKLRFNRMECSPFYYAEGQSDTMRVMLHFLFGNLLIGSRRCLTIDDCFRGNNFRSYMLNETNIPPRLNGEKTKK